MQLFIRGGNTDLASASEFVLKETDYGLVSLLSILGEPLTSSVSDSGYETIGSYSSDCKADSCSVNLAGSNPYVLRGKGFGNAKIQSLKFDYRIIANASGIGHTYVLADSSDIFSIYMYTYNAGIYVDGEYFGPGNIYKNGNNPDKYVSRSVSLSFDSGIITAEKENPNTSEIKLSGSGSCSVSRASMGSNWGSSSESMSITVYFTLKSITFEDGSSIKKNE